MIQQLLLTKRIFIEAENFAGIPDSISVGLAISLLQDSIEQYVWTLIKEKGLDVKDNSSFTSNLDLIKSQGYGMPFEAKIRELNKARVSFKHYGILPSIDERFKYKNYVEDSLRQAMLEHFSVNFDDLSLTDLVSYQTVRQYLKDAERFLLVEEYNEAAGNLALAKKLLFDEMKKFIPEVDSQLSRLDDLLDGHIRHTKPFKYISKYMDDLRQLSLGVMLQLTPDDSYVLSVLPSTFQTGNGKWHITNKIQYDKTICEQAIKCLVGISIKLKMRL